MHNIVFVLNAIELVIIKWLILRSVSFISKKIIGSSNAIRYSGLDTGTNKDVSRKIISLVFDSFFLVSTNVV